MCGSGGGRDIPAIVVAARLAHAATRLGRILFGLDNPGADRGREDTERDALVAVFLSIAAIAVGTILLRAVLLEAFLLRTIALGTLRAFGAIVAVKTLALRRSFGDRKSVV